MAESQERLDLKRAIGHRIAAARLALGLDQKDILGHVHVAQNAWSQYETGERLPDIQAMIRFCDTFNVSMDWIYREVVSGLPLEIRAVTLEKHAKLLGKRPPNRRSRLSA